jgi:hypothetical protein
MDYSAQLATLRTTVITQARITAMAPLAVSKQYLIAHSPAGLCMRQDHVAHSGHLLSGGAHSAPTNYSNCVIVGLAVTRRWVMCDRHLTSGPIRSLLSAISSSEIGSRDHYSKSAVATAGAQSNCLMFGLG